MLHMPYYRCMDVTKLQLQPGTYVVAVSGGVDSVTLLHLLHQANQAPDRKLVIAHFDHGIRDDSHLDRRHVQSLAKQYGLPFIYDEGRLGATASEASARAARYQFLDGVRKATAARATITAHHQDDALETAILNMLRGTGRKGLSALGNGDGRLRPLLGTSKIDIVNHAIEHGLVWREDSTNVDLRYRRNYIRHKLLPRFDQTARAHLWQMIERQRRLNRAIDHLIDNQLHVQPALTQLDRRWFCALPHDVSKELLAGLLRRRTTVEFDSKTLERLVTKAKTGRPGNRLDIGGGYSLLIQPQVLALVS
jgi:tRNA(Ile)-lysidine synthase